MSDKKYIVTDYDGCEYVTAGKLYEVVDQSSADNPIVLDDYGRKMTCMEPGWMVCAHLNGVGKWRWATEEEVTE